MLRWAALGNMCMLFTCCLSRFICNMSMIPICPRWIPWMPSDMPRLQYDCCCGCPMVGSLANSQSNARVHSPGALGANPRQWPVQQALKPFCSFCSFCAFCAFCLFWKGRFAVSRSTRFHIDTALPSSVAGMLLSPSIFVWGRGHVYFCSTECFKSLPSIHQRNDVLPSVFLKCGVVCLVANTSAHRKRLNACALGPMIIHDHIGCALRA